MTYTREQLSTVIKAYDIRGVVGEGINPELVHDIGAAFAALMKTEGAQVIAVGHDMRDSSPDLAQAFSQGVNSQGLNVVSLGLTSTDELYFASGIWECPGAMFTASHNPAQYNGIKLCRSGARPISQDTGLEDIIQSLLTKEENSAAEQPAVEVGIVTERNILPEYVKFLHSLVSLSDIRPLKVAVDAGNGMGGLTVPAVFADLNVELFPLFFELDGTFPNHEANPLNPDNLVDLQRYVVEVGADIGIAFDGDADRCFIVDEKGEPVSASAVCAMIAQDYLERKPGSTIIHNLITSRTVPELVREYGGKPVRTRVGHSFIKATMAQEKAIFGGEHSAHYYFSEFFNADSGMLAALYVLARLGHSEEVLSEVKKSYDRYHSSGEINSEVKDQQGRTEAVVAAFEERAVSIDRLDGVTIDLGDSWLNVRASNTEPLLRLNVEAPTAEAVNELVAEALAIIRA